MFDNIGRKIKTLAQILAWIGIGASMVIGGMFMSKGVSSSAWIGFSIAAIGSIVSWISSLMIYGFGQLIENTDDLVQITDQRKK